MSDSFSITQAARMASSDDTLLEEIRTHTESDGAAETVLRSIQRFGMDPSIRSFEIIPGSRRGDRRASTAVVWTVRAVRA